jgi:hypothetical protein
MMDDRTGSGTYTVGLNRKQVAVAYIEFPMGPVNVTAYAYDDAPIGKTGMQSVEQQDPCPTCPKTTTFGKPGVSLVYQKQTATSPILSPYDIYGTYNTAVGVGLGMASQKMYNVNAGTWYSLKTMREYRMTFNGNGFTGGKLKHGAFWGRYLAYTGYLLSAYNETQNIAAYKQGNMTGFQFTAETSVVAYGVWGGIYGMSFGIGWELGRAISTTSFWRQTILGLPYGR